MSPNSSLASSFSEMTFPLQRVQDLFIKLLQFAGEDDDLFISTGKKRQRQMKSELKGTEYIGVSRNQRKFQTLIMLGGKKRYIGTYETVEEAARAFDKYSLIYRGLKVEQK